MIKMIAVILLLFVSVSSAQIFNPKLIVQPQEHDFGDIVQGEVVSHIFILTNNGGDLLEITNVRASCGCTAAKPEKNLVAPGESTNLEVTFNSSGRYGKQNKSIRVMSNDPENPEIVLTIKANILLSDDPNASFPVGYFPETKHNFGQVNEGEVVEHTFSFVNKGDAILKVNDIRTSCGCTAALVSKEKLLPGDEGTIKVELNTKNRKGQMSRTITVKTNDPKEPDKILTVYADVIKIEN